MAKNKVIWCNMPGSLRDNLKSETIEQVQESASLVPCLAFLLDANLMCSVSKIKITVYKTFTSLHH